MGEAKRRKQALGTRYGKTPPVLMPESKQLNEHGKQFIDAFFQHLKQCPEELSTMLLQKSEEHSESSDLSEPIGNQAVENWLMGYLEPYRQRDRAKLAGGLLGTLLIRLCKGPQHKEENASTEVSQFIVNLTLYLFCFNALKPFLSDSIREEHEEILQKLHSEMKMDIKADQSIEREDKAEELEMLTKLFNPMLSSKTVPA